VEADAPAPPFRTLWSQSTTHFAAFGIKVSTFQMLKTSFFSFLQTIENWLNVTKVTEVSLQEF